MNENDSNERQRRGRTAGMVGLAVNIALFGMKIFAGVVSGSIAVTADALNNLSDAATSAVTYFGFYLSSKPADKEHPYGHARIEYLSGLLVAVLIIFVGYELARSSIDKIITPSEYRATGLMVAILVISVLIKAGLWFYYRRTAGRISSLVLTAAATDSRNDVFATASILVSLAVRNFTGFDPDGYIGLGISLMIVYFGIRLVIDAASPLIGAAPPKTTVEILEKTILSYSGVIGVHDLQLHSYGYQRYFATAHCEVSASTNLSESHELADRIERDIARSLEISLVIHVDPVDSDDVKTTEAFENISRMLKAISPVISLHDFRAVWGSRHVKFIFDVEVPFDYGTQISELKKKIGKSIKEIYPLSNAIITFDRK
jgi:cation diffusion facilitator family transporter